MTNREYLNTLSDEEFVKTVYADEGEVSDMVDWLQAKHITTADEDASLLGWELSDVHLVPFYRHKEGWFFQIWENGMFSGFFPLEMTDQIRTIADKKRKEMGWNK